MTVPVFSSSPILFFQNTPPNGPHHGTYLCIARATVPIQNPPKSYEIIAITGSLCLIIIMNNIHYDNILYWALCTRLVALSPLPVRPVCLRCGSATGLLAAVLVRQVEAVHRHCRTINTWTGCMNTWILFVYTLHNRLMHVFGIFYKYICTSYVNIFRSYTFFQ